MPIDVHELQRSLNRFTSRYLAGVNPLVVDGDKGKATNTRIRTAKYYLGYGEKRDGKVPSEFVRRMRHPRSTRYSTVKMVATGIRRRTAQKVRWAQQQVVAVTKPGVSRFDGVPVAKWLVPYLNYARTHGWQGQLVSGYRTPEYSDSLCQRMCGAPSCPGLCAGRASNHSGDTPPRGALDVSDYFRFAEVVAGCPLSPRIYNDLPRDRVHFSSNGH